MSTFKIGAVQRVFSRSIYKKPASIKVAWSRNLSSSAKPGEPSTLKLALVGAACGAIVGTTYSVYSAWTDKVTDHIIHERKNARIYDQLPNVKIIKRIHNPKDDSDLNLVLFQFQTCPFCCKVRSFLDFMGLSYSIVEVDAVLKQDLKWSDYKKVPMILAKTKDGKYVQLTDSSTIISVISSFLFDKSKSIEQIASLYPNVSFVDDDGTTKFDVLNKYFLMFGDKAPKNISNNDMHEERKWRRWADTHLVHLISPNVYGSREEALKTFEWFAEAGEWDIHFPKWERDMMVYVGAMAMWLISKRLRRRHGLSDDVRSHMYDALDSWTNALERKKTKFMGGKSPNLADLAVFGVLSSMEGCQAFKDCLENTKIGNWFYDVKKHVMENRGHLVRDDTQLNLA